MEEEKNKPDFFSCIITPFSTGKLSYLSNWICMVLMIEKDAKHPFVKGCAVITLLLLAILGIFQLREAKIANEEARKANVLALKNLEIATASLNLSNKLNAYNILSNKNTDEYSFIKSYELLSRLENPFRININNKKLIDSIVVGINNKSNFDANFQIKNSSLSIRIPFSRDFELGVTNSLVEMYIHSQEYGKFLIDNSELHISNLCKLISYGKKVTYIEPLCLTYEKDDFNQKYEFDIGLNNSKFFIKEIDNADINITYQDDTEINISSGGNNRMSIDKLGKGSANINIENIKDMDLSFHNSCYKVNCIDDFDRVSIVASSGVINNDEMHNTHLVFYGNSIVKIHGGLADNIDYIINKNSKLSFYDIRMKNVSFTFYDVSNLEFNNLFFEGTINVNIANGVSEEYVNSLFSNAEKLIIHQIQ